MTEQQQARQWETITGYARRSEAGLVLFLAGRTEAGVKVGARILVDWPEIETPGAVSRCLDKMTAKLDERGCS